MCKKGAGLGAPGSVVVYAEGANHISALVLIVVTLVRIRAGVLSACLPPSLSAYCHLSSPNKGKKSPKNIFKCSGVKVQYLDPRCSGVEVKVMEIGNSKVLYKYLKIVLKYSK